MTDRIVTIFERSITTTVNDIEHMESTTCNGVSVTPIYFQPNVRIEMAIAPPGTFAPLIVSFDASSVPILQLGLRSNTLSEAQLYDYGQNFIRTQLATVQGAAIPLPYGGKVRAIMDTCEGAMSISATA